MRESTNISSAMRESTLSTNQPIDCYKIKHQPTNRVLQNKAPTHQSSDIKEAPTNQSSATKESTNQPIECYERKHQPTNRVLQKKAPTN